jgi:hypothetical protein
VPACPEDPSLPFVTLPSPPLPPIEISSLPQSFVACAPPDNIASGPGFPSTSLHAFLPLLPAAPLVAAAPFGSPSAPSVPFAPLPATSSQRASSAVDPSASTAIDEPPSFAASAAWIAKSSTRAPLALLFITSGIASAPAVNVVFVVAPAYAHPFAQSSPPYISIPLSSTSASSNVSAHAYTRRLSFFASSTAFASVATGLPFVPSFALLPLFETNTPHVSLTGSALSLGTHAAGVPPSLPPPPAPTDVAAQKHARFGFFSQSSKGFNGQQAPSVVTPTAATVIDHNQLLIRIGRLHPAQSSLVREAIDSLPAPGNHDAA